MMMSAAIVRLVVVLAVSLPMAFKLLVLLSYYILITATNRIVTYFDGSVSCYHES